MNARADRKSTRLNSSHSQISYAVFCLKKKTESRCCSRSRSSPPPPSSRSITPFISIFFFFNDTATTEIYTLSLHDALPISLLTHRHVGDQRIHLGSEPPSLHAARVLVNRWLQVRPPARHERAGRSEEHTSELQSQSNLVCRLLLEKKNREPVLQPLEILTTPSIVAKHHTFHLYLFFF